MNIESWFSATYAEARSKFLAACADSELSIEHHRNPRANGARGEALFTDVARIGPADAHRTLALISGTHGVEGYCGSGAQIGLLRSGAFDALPPDTSVLLIHALNPYGFSHDRRVNEDNIDINRNFIDFTSAYRPQSHYHEIHDHLVPDDWRGPARASADDKLSAYIAARGMCAFQAAVTSGQYDNPDGLFYGGSAPSWSNAVIGTVLTDHVAAARAVAVIDFHTGLGPYGHGELIAIGNEAQKTLSATIYGNQVTDPESGTSSSAPLDGMLAHGIAARLTDTQLSFITIEFGTYDIDTVLTALRGDNWLYQKAAMSNPHAESIKGEIRRAFYPDVPDWKGLVWSRSLEVTELALEGLASL
ncbi:MAG: M14 family metallopeptidase [Pseudomonadota bacterium]